MILALLLGIAGCGCNDDSTTVFGGPDPTRPALLIKTRMPPIPVPPPTEAPERCKIDVMFVLDDSDGMNDTLLGRLPENDLDTRKRSEAVQTIMKRIQATIRQRLADAYNAPNVDAGTPPFDLDSLDFAFGVSRFEDFGGGFTDPDRRAGDVDDPNNSSNDQDARPFILNMPILRDSHPQFTTLFDDAMQREAPGDGNPAEINFGFPIPIADPQSSIEALYQLAAPANPDGSFGGFDANGDNDTQDSGLPTSLDPTRNPQTLPGASGDVPAVAFRDIGTDADGEPLFQVQGVVDNVLTDVTVPDPTGAPVPSISSGNIGGAGWRENSVRFIILASDIAAVAPMDTAPTGPEDIYDPALGVTLPPGPNQEISSTDGGTDAPRTMDTVKTRAFDGGVQVESGVALTDRRIGLPGGGVAPTNAHTINDAIAALNALDIEVLLIGAPFIGGLDTKPGALGVNGDSDSHKEEYDPSANVGTPFGPTSDIEPWLWMTAVNRLTTPEITSEVRPGVLDTFPAVYNIGTVWRFPEATPRDTITDDLAERIRGWIDPQSFTSDPDSPFKAPLVGGVIPIDQRPPLPTAAYDFRAVVGAPSNADIVGDNVAPQFDVNGVAIPTYWNDQTAPAAVEVLFPAADDIGYLRANENVVLPATGTALFNTYATFTDAFTYGGGETPDAATEAKIRAAILARLGVDGARNPVSQEIRVGSASYTITVRDATDPLATSSAIELIAAGAQGCAIILEQTVGVTEADEEAGTCPFPVNP